MVEDEALILEIMSESLEDAGYNVMTVADGPNAIRCIDTQPANHFSLLFSDYHLPGGLTGVDVAAAMRARYPNIPVVIATGRPDVLDARWHHAEGFVLVRKPYGPKQLLSVLGQLVPPHRPANRSP